MSITKDKEGYWHVNVCIDRQRVHRRLPKGGTKTEAETIKAEIIQSLKARKYSADPTLIEIMDLYMEHAKNLRSPESAELHAIRSKKWIVGYRASEFKKCAVLMIDGLLKEGLKPATINRTLGTIKKGLSLAFDREIISINYGERVKRLPENNHREVYLSIEQVKKIADRASMNVRAAIWIAVYTGMRRGEILKLNEAEIGDDEITILSGNTKTLRRRTVPITKQLRPWLNYLPLPITAEGLKSGFQRARKSAGMEHVNFHDLRHSTASLLIKSGVPLEVIRKILGHSTPKMTERYAHIEVEQQRKALQKAFGK
jgi:integrase